MILSLYQELNSTDCITEHTEDEGLGTNIAPSHLYQREIQPSELVSLERSDFEEQQENSEKQDKEKDGILE